tara:strand:+ start:462 stop:1061 length:600 start_codon:yes stop_codon:yes gene_type:complete
MKKLPINKNHLNPHFIGSWAIEPVSICEDLINYFELNLARQKTGRAGDKSNLNFKDSIDITVKPKEIILPGNEAFKAYFERLFECYKNYIEEWPFLKDIAHNLEIGSFNLQRYKPGQHFKKIHTERSDLKTLHRVFAFMTYLNDIEEGGSTYFSHYDLEIQPQQARTLIWPAEWTHAHRGNLLTKGTKYIITGWINFTN